MVVDHAYRADLIFELVTAEHVDRDSLEDIAVTITEYYRVGDEVTPAVKLAFAIVYAINGWEIIPLRDKAPAIGNPHPEDSRERLDCKGECGLDGHGVYDATTDLATIIRWWGIERRGANIGARVPKPLFALDSDPRKEGHAAAAAALTSEHGPFPATLTTLSGRLDGGTHRFYWRPAGKLTKALLGPGFDIKDHGGYVVLPPSIHPDTRLAYVGIDAPVAEPGWLTNLIVEKPRAPRRQRTGASTFLGASGCAIKFTGESVADQYSENTSWADVLMPHGWACKSNDPDADGAIWLHPNHTSKCSATVRHGCLFVYSTNTPFRTTEAGAPNGYTRFRAYTVLNFGGDTSQHMAAAVQHLTRKVP